MLGTPICVQTCKRSDCHLQYSEKYTVGRVRAARLLEAQFGLGLAKSVIRSFVGNSLVKSRSCSRSPSGLPQSVEGPTGGPTLSLAVQFSKDSDFFTQLVWNPSLGPDLQKV